MTPEPNKPYSNISCVFFAGQFEIPSSLQLVPVTRIEELAKRTGVLEGGSVDFGWDDRPGRDDFRWL